MGENGLRVPPVFVYNEDMRKKGINMSRVSLWAAVCLLSTFSILAETVAPEGCGLSGRIGELPHQERASACVAARACSPLSVRYPVRPGLFRGRRRTI